MIVKGVKALVLVAAREPLTENCLLSNCQIAAFSVNNLSRIRRRKGS